MNRGHVPTRMCVVCRRRAPRKELVRHVQSPDGESFQTDEGQTLPGRGWYICMGAACMEKFRKARTRGRKRKGESA